MHRLDGAFEYRNDVSPAADLPAKASSAADRSALVVVRLSRGLAHKQDLLAEYVRQLALPNYFGWNWDALEECLRDLSWVETGQTVMIVHGGLPLRGRSRAIYLGLLGEVADYWRGSQVRAVRIVFPSTRAHSIDLALESARG